MFGAALAADLNRPVRHIPTKGESAARPRISANPRATSPKTVRYGSYQMGEE